MKNRIQNANLKPAVSNGPYAITLNANTAETVDSLAAWAARQYPTLKAAQEACPGRLKITKDGARYRLAWGGRQIGTLRSVKNDPPAARIEQARPIPRPSRVRRVAVAVAGLILTALAGFR